MESSRYVSDITGFALEQMYGLDTSDLADGTEDVSTVHCSALDAVAMVDASTSSFFIDVKLSQANKQQPRPQ